MRTALNSRRQRGSRRKTQMTAMTTENVPKDIECADGYQTDGGQRGPARGVTRILHWRGTEAECRRRENRGADGLGTGTAVPFLNHAGWGSGRASWATPAGSGAESRPPTYFWHINSPQNTSGWKNSITLPYKAGSTSQQSQYFR